MNEGSSKERKPYKKPSYEPEEILEKMSLACKTTYPPAGPCKESTAVNCSGVGNQIT